MGKDLIYKVFDELNFAYDKLQFNCCDCKLSLECAEYKVHNKEDICSSLNDAMYYLSIKSVYIEKLKSKDNIYTCLSKLRNKEDCCNCNHKNECKAFSFKYNLDMLNAIKKLDNKLDLRFSYEYIKFLNKDDYVG